MSVRMSSALLGHLGELRVEPIGKRIRAVVDGEPVVDSVRAMLVYEPRRVVPSYAVPEQDVRAGVVAPDALSGTTTGAGEGIGWTPSSMSGHQILDPSVPFAAHSARGEPLAVRFGGRVLAGFRIDDPALEGYLVLDFAGADAWFEEDERNYAHPRDPFHRIDVVPSSRHVRVELDGTVLADTRRARMLFETLLPTRYYLPRDDVLVELRPSDRTSWCAYKGHASYLSPVLANRVAEGLVWVYREPLHDAGPVRDLLCFFNERVDVVVDGHRQERPVTPWS